MSLNLLFFRFESGEPYSATQDRWKEPQTQGQSKSVTAIFYLQSPQDSDKRREGLVFPGGKETRKVISAGLLSWNQDAEWLSGLAKQMLRAPGK